MLSKPGSFYAPFLTQLTPLVSPPNAEWVSGPFTKTVTELSVKQSAVVASTDQNVTLPCKAQRAGNVP